MTADKSILLKRLQTMDFLQGLDDAVLQNLTEHSVWKIFPPDSVVFWEGDVEPRLFYLQYGSLKVLRSSSDGREQVMRFIDEGEVFNELGVLAKKPNPATAVTLEESGIWLIPREALEDVILAYPQTALKIIENMADKVIGMVSLAADLSLKTVEARFVKLLLSQTDGDVIERRRWTNQTVMASHLGTVPDVLSRVIRELTRAGLIEMDRKQIRILDRKKLAERGMLQGE